MNNAIKKLNKRVKYNVLSINKYEKRSNKMKTEKFINGYQYTDLYSFMNNKWNRNRRKRVETSSSRIINYIEQ